MIFIKPNYFEVTLANWKKDDFQDEVLICTINEKYEVIEHSPIDFFFYSRSHAIITGFRGSDDWTSKNLMSLRTKIQEYAGWDPVITIHDFERMIQKKIKMELAKEMAYAKGPKEHPHYKHYG